METDSRVAKPLDIAALLSLSEDAVWMLQKRDLRQYFLALQTHLRSLSLPGSDPVANIASSIASSQERPTHAQASPLLSLPPEIRRLILIHLLGRPASSPARGPHPRTLQSPLALTRAMEPAILRTCRQLYVEGCSVLYGMQEIHANIDFDVWKHRLDRSQLAVASVMRDAVRSLHVHVFLGNEKRNAKPGKKESEARLEVVRKGAKKLVKWLCGLPVNDVTKESRLQTLRISWQEPPQTYTWEQKKTVLDEFRAMRPYRVEAGEINWGLKYPGKKFRFEEEYLQELGQERLGGGADGQGKTGASSSGQQA